MADGISTPDIHVTKRRKTRLLSSNEISVFCRQMSLMLAAGIGTLEGIDLLLHDTHDPDDRQFLEDIMHILLSGEKFHIALQMSGVFPGYMIHMTTIGEESGTLDIVMDSLADYYDREDDIKESIQNAIGYPMLMIMLMLIVIGVLIIHVLPIFSQVFAQLGTSMNTFSQTLLNVGQTLNRYSFIILGLLILIGVLFFYFSRTDSGRARFIHMTRNVGPLAKIYEDMAKERFASGMVLMLSSGMDTFESLNLVRNLVDSPTMRKQIEACQSNIMDEGDSFPEAIEKAGIFNQFYSRMLSIGFRTGSMDTVMRQISNRYAEITQRRIYAFISVLEPTLVIVLSMIVGLILMSVILPLMGIMSSMG